MPASATSGLLCAGFLKRRSRPSEGGRLSTRSVRLRRQDPTADCDGVRKVGRVGFKGTLGSEIGPTLHTSRCLAVT